MVLILALCPRFAVAAEIVVTDFGRPSSDTPSPPTFSGKDGWSGASSFRDEADNASPSDPESGIQVTEFLEEADHRSLDAIPLPANGSPVARLFAVIEAAESPQHGYDAVHLKAAVKPPALPTRMTIQQILDWIAATPGQFHAIGRYQIVPGTLEVLIEKSGAPLDTLFDQRLQDRFAVLLVDDAGYQRFLADELPLEDFMDNLAKVWAGLPLANGKSAYHGYAGNRATVSRDAYLRAMVTIFPKAATQVASLP